MRSFYLLLLKEIKEIFFSKTTALFLIILSFMIGYSFYSAVSLYSNASVSAINNPLYATGFEPNIGVFVPSFGGLFLLFSLFLPFIIIPLISLEKEQNTMSILVQIPFSFNKILLSKFIASFLFLIFVFLLETPSLIIWKIYGGHIPWTEFLLLNLGYLFYGIFIISISIFSASIFKSTASASISSILIVIISWIIDFGKDMNISPLILTISNWTTTSRLNFFEQGIFSFSSIVYFIVLFLFFIFLSRCFLDIKFRKKYILFSIITAFLGIITIFYFNFNIDLTESNRNSFPKNITNALLKTPKITIDIYMRREDSRFKDYKDSFLDKLSLIKRNVEVNFMKGKELKDKYGLFVYKINNKFQKTYSNSEEEIFPIIFKLSNIKLQKIKESDKYQGYPLIVKKARLNIISYVYYLFVPLLFLIFYFTRIKFRASKN